MKSRNVTVLYYVEKLLGNAESGWWWGFTSDIYGLLDVNKLSLPRHTITALLYVLYVDSVTGWPISRPGVTCARTE
jgi:hypothetical protein